MENFSPSLIPLLIGLFIELIIFVGIPMFCIWLIIRWIKKAFKNK